jgi:Skp family chaperone for outer membrane proteins
MFRASFLLTFVSGMIGSFFAIQKSDESDQRRSSREVRTSRVEQVQTRAKNVMSEEDIQIVLDARRAIGRELREI